MPRPVRRSAAELERLGEEIAELAAHIDAATHRLLVRLLEFDRSEGWGGGFVTCAHWLSWRTGIDLGAAREKVRVARALEHLPRISEALRTGRLSYSRVRALTRVATPESEEALVHFALHATTAHVERLVRAWRRVDRQEDARAERERHASRYVTLTSDGDGMFELRGRLDPEAAMALKRALEAASWALYRQGGAASDTPAAARRADAIGLVAECALSRACIGTSPAVAAGPADHRLIVMHVDEQALGVDADAGDALLEDGTRVAAETSRRFACDASRLVMTHGADGSVLGVGRKTRTVPPALRRALDQRDGGCRFPGCGSRFCDAHHARHWADGGETRLDNLVLLCRIHHRAVHEDGFGVRIVAGAPSFSRPDGRALPDVPENAPLDGDPLARLCADHAAEGLHITPATSTPRSGAERFDLDWAIAALWRPQGPATATEVH